MKRWDVDGADLLERELESGKSTRRPNSEPIPGYRLIELLAYLREAAEALDLMNIQHGLQHLDVKPQNLFLVSSHIKVADFGLVSSLAGLQSRSSLNTGTMTPVYAPPEVFEGSLSPHCD